MPGRKKRLMPGRVERSSLIDPEAYLNDPRLRRCSPSAQGFWLRLVALAGLSERFGFVQLSGEPADAEELAEYRRDPIETVRSFLAELETLELIRRDEGGALYVPDLLHSTGPFHPNRQQANGEGV